MAGTGMSEDYLIGVHKTMALVPADEWNELLAAQSTPTPFMRHEYLWAMERSESACPGTGWTPLIFTLRRAGALVGACAAYLKSHSRGEYVFDWAWAEAYERHGLAYYPKAVVAVPFTPVPGSRLLATDAATRQALLQALLKHLQQAGIPSLHLLFGSTDDQTACEHMGLLQRDNVQFHWHNPTPSALPGATGRFPDFDTFLASLNQEKRKKIRQERRKVANAGVHFEWRRGAQITEEDWDFFYRCYVQTYLEHGNRPYLTRSFFAALASEQPQAWLMFVAHREGRRIASSLIALQETASDGESPGPKTAYGRYWGALERVDCLHFEACYYQPIEWCIAQGYDHFEGGAQGEHKMARALMPVPTFSAHWLSHPAFAQAVQRFVTDESAHVAHYLGHLHARNPFRRGGD